MASASRKQQCSCECSSQSDAASLTATLTLTTSLPAGTTSCETALVVNVNRMVDGSNSNPPCWAAVGVGVVSRWFVREQKKIEMPLFDIPLAPPASEGGVHTLDEVRDALANPDVPEPGEIQKGGSHTSHHTPHWITPHNAHCTLHTAHPGRSKKIGPPSSRCTPLLGGPSRGYWRSNKLVRRAGPVRFSLCQTRRYPNRYFQTKLISSPKGVLAFRSVNPLRLYQLANDS